MAVYNDLFDCLERKEETPHVRRRAERSTERARERVDRWETIGLEYGREEIGVDDFTFADDVEVKTGIDGDVGIRMWVRTDSERR